MALYVLLFAVFRTVLTLQVTPGSPCAANCLDSLEGNDFKASDSTTNASDVGCKDADYVTTDRGVKFRECVDCLQTSTKFAEGESDVKWYICGFTFSLCAPAKGIFVRTNASSWQTTCDMPSVHVSTRCPRRLQTRRLARHVTWTRHVGLSKGL